MIFGAKKRWFTLVEMLIVIVIIWVLAAALIPRLTSVRWRANDVARKADIQQLATAIITYQMDNNGALPIAVTGHEYSTSWITWALITAWMDWLPVDPVPMTVFEFYTNYPIATWQYGYMRLTKDGVANNWFILMAKTQTAWWSNRVATGDVWAITWGTSTENITTCKTVTRWTTDESNGWDCKFTTIANLRYIMVR